MTTELGHFALCLAFIVAIAQTVLPFVGARAGRNDWAALAVPAAQVHALLIGFSFAALASAYLASDFSVLNVTQNSHSAKPWLYKLTGTWGNHEGSMLLWVLTLAAFGAAVATVKGGLDETFRARVLGVHGLIGVAFLAFVLFTSNPFARLDPAPVEGTGLNPLLQDPGLAFHPPFLYVGYVGFSMAFSFAVAALISGKVDANWARWVRPWTLAAWIALTIGIALGSWWAYYELGWGGWWFWDPVENASLMPWLLGTALLHSAIVVEKRGAMKHWTILLAILTFSFSLLGTFLVRSGVLTSVHAFANDPERGVFILMILVGLTGGALALYAMRSKELSGGKPFAVVSREGGLVFNNLILVTSCITVMIGTLYPLALDAVGGGPISVGPPYFNATVVPLMMPLLLAVPVGAMLPWKKGDVATVMPRLYWAAGAAFVLVLLVYGFVDGGPVLAALSMGVAAWLFFGSLASVADRVKLGSEPLAVSLRRARHLPRTLWGMALAHAGLGIAVAGITGVTAFQTEQIVSASPGARIEIAGYTVHFDAVRDVNGPNYIASQGVFRLERDGKELGVLTPERRFYPASEQPTTEVGIHTTGFADLYVVLGDPQVTDGSAPQRWSVRTYHKPLIPWLWLGVAVMVVGGLTALTDRRRALSPVPEPRASLPPVKAQPEAAG